LSGHFRGGASPFSEGHRLLQGLQNAGRGGFYYATAYFSSYSTTPVNLVLAAGGWSPEQTLWSLVLGYGYSPSFHQILFYLTQTAS